MRQSTKHEIHNDGPVYQYGYAVYNLLEGNNVADRRMSISISD